MSYGYCIVPNCGSTTVKSPEKWFIAVPIGQEIRERWYDLMRRKDYLSFTRTSMYVCRDHFNLPEVVENYMNIKLIRNAGGPTIPLQLKKDVLPSKFECQQETGCRSNDEIPVLVENELIIKDEPITEDEELVSNDAATPCVASSSQTCQPQVKEEAGTLHGNSFACSNLFLEQSDVQLSIVWVVDSIWTICQKLSDYQ